MDPKDRLLLSATYNDAYSLCIGCGLTEHPLAPRDVWVACVNAGATDEGYWRWASAQLEQAMDKEFPNKYGHAKVAAATSKLMTQAKTIARQASSPPPSLEDFQKMIQGDF